MTRERITRRAALLGLTGGGLILSGCDKLSQNPAFKSMLETAEKFSLRGQRLVLNSSAPLARSGVIPMLVSPIWTRPSTRAAATPTVAQSAERRTSLR